MTFDLGYLMGIVVGEGSFTAGPRLSVGMIVSDPEPIQALHARLGGRIYGPYGPYSGRDQAQWEYQLFGKALYAAIPLFDQYLPQSRKRRQYHDWKTTHARWMAYHAKRAAKPIKVPRVRIERQRLVKASPLPSREVQEARRRHRAAQAP